MAALLALALSDYWWSWGDLVFRWLHVVAAIAWIGSSFYFIALDNHLEPPARSARRGARRRRRGRGRSTAAASTASRSSGSRPSGCRSRCTGSSGRRTRRGSPASRCSSSSTSCTRSRSWSTRPSRPDDLGGDRDLGRRARARLARLRRALPRVRERRGAARGARLRVRLRRRRGASASSSPRGPRTSRSARCSGRSWSANVFFVIIPAHWKLVRAKEAGREPDPRWNPRGKQRSVHNNYLTLPVVFAMLSNHFPFTYGHTHAWLILVALMALGAWMRHYFNLRHRAGTCGGSCVVAAGGIARARAADPAEDAPRAPARAARRCRSRTVQAIVAHRCAPCHSLTPTAGYALAAGRGRARHAAGDRANASLIDRTRCRRTRCRSGTSPR